MMLVRKVVSNLYFEVKGMVGGCTGQERLIRSHSSARFCFEISGNSN